MSEYNKRLYSMMSLEQLREEFICTLDTEALPRELLYEVHTRLWAWILKHAEDFPSKDDWPGWDSAVGFSPAYFGGHEILNNCFLCTQHPTCAGCPLEVMHKALSVPDNSYCRMYATRQQARRDRDLDRFRELTQLILNAPNWMCLDASTYDDAACC